MFLQYHIQCGEDFPFYLHSKHCILTEVVFSTFKIHLTIKAAHQIAAIDEANYFLQYILKSHI